MTGDRTGRATSTSRPSRALIAIGLLLLAAGLALWAAAAADLTLHRLLRLHDAGAWTPRTVALSWAGGATGMIPLGLIGVALLATRRRAREAAWLFATVASGRLAVEAIKIVVQRPRPPIADRLELVTSWSFPSSHSAGTAMTCVALALLARRRWGWGAAALAALAIGWTRVALAVHWPSDVLAGWGFGLMWVGAAWRWVPVSPPCSPA